jgi:hypothetical protein
MHRSRGYSLAALFVCWNPAWTATGRRSTVLAVRGLVGVVSSVIALFAVSACGGGGEAQGGAPPDEWAADFCSAVRSWEDDFIEEGNKLQQEGFGVRNGEEARALVASSLETIIARTDAMLAELEAAGSQAVDEGEEIARVPREELALFKAVLERARDQAMQLPDDVEAFNREGKAIAEDVAAGARLVLERLKAGTDTFDARELREAFNGARNTRGRRSRTQASRKSFFSSGSSPPRTTTTSSASSRDR